LFKLGIKLLEEIIECLKLKKFIMKTLVGNKNIESGYVWAPYIPMTTTSVISDYSSKSVSRKRKINNIFDLGLDIKDEFFPKKSLVSRYSQGIQISNYYSIIVTDLSV